jgi:hypothetical protein
LALQVARYRPRVVATVWLTLLSILAVSQTLHLFEHVAQMVQIHILGLAGANAQGIVGQLNIEWVHFIWNGWVLVTLVVLLPRFPRNWWLIGVALFAGWHLLEHAVIMATYLRTGVVGSPGLLSAAGLINGGLPLARPDLHFLYNLVETIPLLIGWRVELKRV